MPLLHLNTPSEVRELRAIKYLKRKNSALEEELVKSTGVNTDQLERMVNRGYIERTFTGNVNTYSLGENGLIVANRDRSVLGYLYRALRDSIRELR